MKIVASAGLLALSRQDALLRYRALSLVSTRIRLLANRASAQYCQPQTTDTWFATAPGTISLPSAPVPTVNANPVPPNSVAVPADFDAEDPDLCQLFQTILPVNVDPVYPEEQSVDALWKPFSEIIKAVSISRTFIKIERLNYPLNLEQRNPVLRLRPVIQLINKQIKSEVYAFALIGQNATFNYLGQLKAIPGKFIVGKPFSWLLRLLRLPASAQNYTISGQSDLLYSRLLSAQLAAFAIVSEETYLSLTRIIASEPGDFELNGYSSGFLLDQTIGANNGTINLDGQVANLIYSRPDLLADSGSYILTGMDADLRRALVANNATFDLYGFSADIKWNQILQAVGGSTTLDGLSTDLLQSYYLGADRGEFAVSVETVNLLYNYLVIAENGTISLDPEPASLKTFKLLLAGGGSVSLTGESAAIYSETPYFASFVEQWYGWEGDTLVDWWAD